MIPRLALPPSPALLLLVALAFVVPGLVHDPWKTTDLVSIEIAHEMLRTGDWIVPRVAGLAWLEDPPLYHWAALGFGAALAWLAPFHEGARLASGFFMLLAIGLVYAAARASAGREDAHAAGASAMLLLAGSVGLIVQAHEANPKLAALAASAGAFAALARHARRPREAGGALRWGAAFGVALGAAFLATGPVVPAALFAAAVLAHLACDEWRSRHALVFLAAAALAAAALALAWLALLAARSPEAFEAWRALVARPRGELLANLRYYVVAASWYAWPAWPLALWALFSLRREWRTPRLFVPAAASLLALVGVAFAGPTQTGNAAALLVPLALLAVPGVAALRRGAAAALDWFGVMTFAFFAALVWLGYVAMMAGVPPRIAHNFAKTAPGFLPEFDAAALVFAIALTLGWLYVVFFTRPAATRSLLRWAAGVILLWGTFIALWLPWVDYQHSYRSVALQLRSKMPAAAECVAGRNVGPAQRAALHYHGGILTLDLDAPAAERCPLLLVQGHPRHERYVSGSGGAKLADVGRPGDKSERYRLYALQR